MTGIVVLFGLPAMVLIAPLFVPPGSGAVVLVAGYALLPASLWIAFRLDLPPIFDRGAKAYLFEWSFVSRMTFAVAVGLGARAILWRRGRPAIGRVSAVASGLVVATLLASTVGI